MIKMATWSKTEKLILAVFTIAVCLSCKPTKEEKKIEYTSAENVQKALAEAVDFDRVNSVKEGEFVAKESTMNVIGNPLNDRILINKKLVLKINEEVIHSKCGGPYPVNSAYYADVFIEADKQGNITSERRFEEKMCYLEGLNEITCSCVSKSRPPMTAAQVLENNLSLLSGAKANVENSPTWYSNLVVRTVVVDPPPIIKGKENCGGIPNCKLNATEITYEQEYLEGGKKRTAQVVTIITKEVPWFATFLSQCFTGVMVIGFSEDGSPKEAPATRCTHVVNFES